MISLILKTQNKQMKIGKTRESLAYLFFIIAVTLSKPIRYLTFNVNPLEGFCHIAAYLALLPLE